MHLAPGDIPELLRAAKTVAIVGVSDKADRASSRRCQVST